MNEVTTIKYTVDAIREADIYKEGREGEPYVLYRGPSIDDAYRALGEAREHADRIAHHSFVAMRIWDDEQSTQTALVWERF